MAKQWPDAGLSQDTLMTVTALAQAEIDDECGLAAWVEEIEPVRVAFDKVLEHVEAHAPATMCVDADDLDGTTRVGLSAEYDADAESETRGHTSLYAMPMYPQYDFELAKLEIKVIGDVVQNVETLVDSGANISLMSTGLFAKLQQKQANMTIHKNQPLRLRQVTRFAATQTAPFVSVPLQLGHPASARHTFAVVEGLPVDVLLGTDFLGPNKANIDFDANIITFGTLDTDVPFRWCTERKPRHSPAVREGEVSTLFCTHDIELAPGEQQWVETAVPWYDACYGTSIRGEVAPRNVVTSRNPDGQPHADRVSVGRGIHRLAGGGRIAVRVANLTDTTLAIAANAAVAEFHVTHGPDVQYAEEAFTDTPLPASGYACGAASVVAHVIATAAAAVAVSIAEATTATCCGIQAALRAVAVVDTLPSRPPVVATAAATQAHTSPEPKKTAPDPLDDLEGLSETQKAQVREFIKTYDFVFAKDPKSPGRTNAVEHVIDTGDARPISHPLRRQGWFTRTTIAEHVQAMLKAGIIRPSKSPWAAPAVLVKKPDGSWRFCVDYRGLNSLTKSDRFPMPRADDCLASLGDAKWFTSLDCAAGFWQVEVAEADKEKTAFATAEGLFEFVRMPFGLKNSPATWCRLVAKVCAGLCYKNLLAYVDDLVVFSSGSLQDHLNQVATVFDRLSAAGITLKRSKCHFARREVHFLGHKIGTNGVSVAEAKIRAIKQYPRPTNVAEVRSFNGMTVYYSKFIKDYGKIAAPLYALTRKGARAGPNFWTDAAESAFQTLKARLASAPVLAHPDWHRPFTVDVDACKEGLGAVLSQKDDDGEERVVCYISRTLRGAEKRYCPRQYECLGVLWALKSLKPFLIGHKFTVRTDHKSLMWLQKARTNDTVFRWSLMLADFDFDIEWRSGAKHANADSLSRAASDGDAPAKLDPLFPAMRGVDTAEAMVVTRSKAKQSAQRHLKISHHSLSQIRKKTNSPYWSQRLAQQQRTDLQLAPMFALLERGEAPANSRERKALVAKTKNLFVDSNAVLCRRWVRRDGQVRIQRVIPKATQQSIMALGHDGPLAGHLGFNKTLSKLQASFWWPEMEKSVADWVRSCIICRRNKATRSKKAGLLSNMYAQRPFDRVHVDLYGSMATSASGYKFVLVAVDKFTKWVELIPLKEKSAEAIADGLLSGVVCRHGCPRTLISDFEATFMSDTIAELCRKLGITRATSAPNHQQANGQVERFMRVLTASLRAYVSKMGSDWDTHLQPIAFAYRTSVNTATNKTPFFMMHGREATQPAELLLQGPVENDAQEEGQDESKEQEEEKVGEDARLLQAEREKKARNVEAAPTTTTSPANEYSNNLVSKLNKAHQEAKQQMEKEGLKNKKLYDKGRQAATFALGDLAVTFLEKNVDGKSRKLVPQWSHVCRVVEIDEKRNNYVLKCTRTGKYYTRNVADIRPYVELTENNEDNNSWALHVPLEAFKNNHRLFRKAVKQSRWDALKEAKTMADDAVVRARAKTKKQLTRTRRPAGGGVDAASASVEASYTYSNCIHVSQERE